MTDDLVKRLRARTTADKFVLTEPGVLEMTQKDDPLTTEAADRIEQLEAALRDVTERHQVTHCHTAARAALAPRG